MAREGGKVDCTGWEWGFSDALGEILNKGFGVLVSEAIENSLASQEPFITLEEIDGDLVIVVGLYAFGDDGPCYKQSLADVIQETIYQNGALDVEHATQTRKALVALAQRLLDTLEKAAEKQNETAPPL